MKLQAPSSKLQRSSKFQAPKVWAASAASLVLGVCCFSGAWSLVLGASADSSADGYGPPTSLPPNYSVTTPAARPRPNWIDQSQAAADAKSSGCIQCHAGVEPMHKNTQNVVLGRTDCHGGNPAPNLDRKRPR